MLTESRADADRAAVLVQSESKKLEEPVVAEKAATTIQATYRGYKTRKQMKQIKPKLEEKRNEDQVIVTEFNTQNDIDRSKNDLLSSASLPTENLSPNTSNNPSSSSSAPTHSVDNNPYKNWNDNKDNNDIDRKIYLADNSNQALEASATKIQATYRGFRTRKQLQEKSSSSSSSSSKGSKIYLKKPSLITCNVLKLKFALFNLINASNIF